MNKEISNSFYNKETPQRWIRVINEDTGEYYDIPITTGTSLEQRELIADNIKLFASDAADFFLTPTSHIFEWTRIILYAREKGVFLNNNGEIGTSYYREQPEGEFVFYKIDMDMNIIEDSKTVCDTSVVKEES